jgi:hypothetical protein
MKAAALVIFVIFIWVNPSSRSELYIGLADPDIIGAFPFLTLEKRFRNWNYTPVDTTATDERYGEEVAEGEVKGLG